jgi:O-antigen ligase
VHALSRFANGRDFRYELWQDTQFAIAQYWPFGSGVGSFKPVFVAAERLEVVDPSEPVRAHNDFLELALEGGIFGLVMLALACALIGWLLWRALRLRNAETRPQIVFAATVFLVVALHSVVDYPVRSMSLACLVGIAVGLSAPVALYRYEDDS